MERNDTLIKVVKRYSKKVQKSLEKPIDLCYNNN